LPHAYKGFGAAPLCTGWPVRLGTTPNHREGSRWATKSPLYFSR
jgi:hypothetical protein